MTSQATRLTIPVPGSGSITAERTEPAPGNARLQPGAPRRDKLLFVYAPGAASNLRDPFGVFLSQTLAEQGIASVRFQFLYQEARRKTPDRQPLLEATWRAVLQAVRAKDVAVVAGGRSMGGRIASHVVAASEPVAGLALFAYPLRPPGQPGRIRDAHLPSIAVPTLFCAGTRDSFGTPEELTAAASKVPQGRVHLLDGADHSFNVLKSTGRTRQDVYREAAEAFVRFLGEHRLIG